MATPCGEASKVQGNLQFYKRRKRKWKLYFFKITSRVYFHYFADQCLSKRKGEMLLGSIKVLIPSSPPKGGQYVFEVQSKKDTWILSASTDNERQRWMESISPGSTSQYTQMYTRSRADTTTGHIQQIPQVDSDIDDCKKERSERIQAMTMCSRLVRSNSVNSKISENYRHRPMITKPTNPQIPPYPISEAELHQGSVPYPEHHISMSRPQPQLPAAADHSKSPTHLMSALNSPTYDAENSQFLQFPSHHQRELPHGYGNPPEHQSSVAMPRVPLGFEVLYLQQNEGLSTSHIQSIHETKDHISSSVSDRGDRFQQPQPIRKSDDPGNAKALLKFSSNSSFHNATVKNISDMLKDESIDPNARDDRGFTSLHWFVTKSRKDRHELLMRCLESEREFDINARDKFDYTPVHIAAEQCDLQYARILIAFGADLFAKNYQGKRPHELAPAGSELMKLLSSFPRPVPSLIEPLCMPHSQDELMKIHDIRNTKIGYLMQPQFMPSLVHLIDSKITEAERATYVKPCNPNSGNMLADSALLLGKQREYVNSWKTTAGNRVLFLDGGGIRGLVQIEVLIELEQRTGCRVVDLFDWIVGTSTGGIVALGLVYAKKSLQELKQFYFKIKNKVFASLGTILSAFVNMNSSSENIEKLLQEEFGDMVMTSVQKPRVMICTVNKEITPMKVQFFNNFMTDCPDLTDVPVWIAGRATSAAPIFFTSFQNKFIDGGVKANNPCQEAMRVIEEYDQLKNYTERHFLLTVSVGTGMYKEKKLDGGDVEKGLIGVKHVQHVKQLIQMFTEALTESESTAKTFAVWCQKARRPIPFFRFNPELEDVVSPGETDDNKVIDLIIKTKLYLADETVSERLDELVTLFKQIGRQGL